MSEPILLPFFLFGTLAFYFGLISLAYYPLAFAYVFWERKLLARAGAAEYAPAVSVLVPAYNEENTIALCIRSVLASDYPDFEVIVIDDGSSDGTGQALRPFVEDGRIHLLTKPNGGKASALNQGLAVARGDIVLFTDADTIFQPNTLRNAVAYFADPSIGAAGGNDTPLDPHGVLQKMLVVTSHIGTGFVRRALSVAGVLPIIPGNLGLVRTGILKAVGGFREIWGEDLELTLRLHRHGVRIVYAARATVRAECPHTFRGLWKQRVRWVRSYIKVVRMHRDMLVRPRFGAFGLYLAFNSFNLVAIPLLQAISLLLLPAALLYGGASLHGAEWLSYVGFWALVAAAVCAIALDSSPRDLKYLPYTLAVIPMSLFYNAVVIHSIWAEWRMRPEAWNKLARRSPALRQLKEYNPWRRRIVIGGTAAAGLAVANAALSPRYAGHFGMLASLDRHAEREGKLTVSVHFPDWPDWRDAYRSLLETPESKYVDQVAISAGRPDWTFFRWDDHESWWSETQSQSSGDMLEEAVAAFSARGLRTVAMLDVFASRYLAQNPRFAAVDIDGRTSRDVVCSTWLAHGEYGVMLAQAFDALAASTRAESVCITELFYDTHCFDERCRLSFEHHSGHSDWPRRADGSIDRMHDSIAAWRSGQVARITARLSGIARGRGKRLLMDVKFSRDDPGRNSRENGQDYRLLRPLVDELVVWDYFAIERLPPEVSGKAAGYLSRYLGPDRYWHSIGLWDDQGGTIDAERMAHAIRAASEGGSENIWITPSGRMTRAHWSAIADFKQARKADVIPGTGRYP